MFERTISLVGQENFNKIKEKTVLVVGLGGVGGYATESLIRSGIHNIILIDHDTVDITNLNRQIISTNKNIGNDKVDEFKKRILDINPNCNVITHKLFLDRTNYQLLDNYKIDYIIDCCDSTDTKKLLIDYSLEKDIKILEIIIAKKDAILNIFVHTVTILFLFPPANKLENSGTSKLLKELIHILGNIIIGRAIPVTLPYSDNAMA